MFPSWLADWRRMCVAIVISGELLGADVDEIRHLYRHTFDPLSSTGQREKAFLKAWSVACLAAECDARGYRVSTNRLIAEFARFRFRHPGRYTANVRHQLSNFRFPQRWMSRLQLPANDGRPTKPKNNTIIQRPASDTCRVFVLPEPPDHWSEDARAMIWHSSGLEMFARCPLQYYNRYIEGIVIPPSAPAVRGSAVHQAANQNLSNKIQTGILLTEEEVQDVAADHFDNAWSDVRLTDEEIEEGASQTRGRMRDDSVRGALLHHTKLAPDIHPVVVEYGFRLHCPGEDFGFAGRIDAVEPDQLRDLKTRGRSPTQATVDDSVQLTLYTLGAKASLGLTPSRVALDNIWTTPKRRETKIKTLWSSRGRSDWTALIRRTRLFTSQVRAGIFPPAERDHWCCSERWCGYWDICAFGARSRSTRIVI